ncbi:MAG: GNAT family N-acetyltransferase [Chloroflexi bacterium]|nr:GNAT family N-acetyltransferase [Chloroflexota bacterium]
MITIRPIQRRDEQMLKEMFWFCSEDSLYRRYLRSYNPTDEEIAQICAITPDEGAAFVATIDHPHQAIVGLAYYIYDGDGTAEPAVLVEDNYQSQGIGKRLLGSLYEEAQQRKVAAFNTYVLADNRPMMHMIRKSGLHYDCEQEYGTFHFRIWLDRQAA